MAQPTQPFAGQGGYGNIMSPYYQQVSSQVGDEYIARENAKVDNAIKAFSEIRNLAAASFGAPTEGGGFMGGIGRATGFTKDAGLMNTMNPSAISQYYAQSSELDKKSNAMKKMLELNPEMFGLDKDQAKQLGDVTSKMSSTERSAFFQTYVPDLFKAQQAKLEQNALSQRASIGKEIAPDISNLGQGLKSVTLNQPTPARTQSLTSSSMPGSEINLQSGADRLQSHMESKYGADWRSRGLKVSRQDVIDAGL